MSFRCPGRRQEERAQRRQDLLRAAIRLFAERGLENVTFGDIAKSTGFSRPLVYFYFPQRELLFLEAVELAKRELHSRFAAAVRPADPGLDQIQALGMAYLRFSEQAPELFALLATAETRELDDWEEHPLVRLIAVHQEAIMGLMVAAIEKGKADGTVRAEVGDSRLVSLCLWAQLHGMIQLRATKQRLLEEAVGGEAQRLPEHGLELLRVALRARPDL